MPYDADGQRDWIGRGMAWPLDIGATGRVNWSVPLTDPNDDDRRAAVGSRIRHLVLTIAGQRCLRREWGSELADLLFLPAIGPLVSSALRSMLLAIRSELPGVDVVAADADIDQAAGVVTFELAWRMVSAGLAGSETIPVGFRGREPNLG